MKETGVRMNEPGSLGSPRDGAVADVMEAIRQRVREKQAQGLYSLDGLRGSAPRDIEPFEVMELIQLEEVAEVTPDMSLVRSTKPGIGKAVGTAKTVLSRATSQPLLDMAVRQSQFNAALLTYLTLLGQEVAELRARVADLEDARESAT